MCNIAKVTAKKQGLDMTQSEEFQGRFKDIVGSMERRLVKAEEGYVGMAPYRVEKGDMVCVLFGCNIPVVLRKRGAGFVFIGECFIDGLTNGEAFNLLECGKLKLGDFPLV